jgi:hypothetical protein
MHFTAADRHDAFLPTMSASMGNPSSVAHRFRVRDAQ